MSTHDGHGKTLDVLQIRWEAASARKVLAGAAILGVLGVAATFLSGRAEPKVAYGAYLVAYVLFLQLALGALFFVMIHHLTGARWGVAVRRIAEGVMATLPVFAVLWIPIWIGREHLYLWTDEALVAKDHVLHAKHAYLNETFFAIRAALYFVIWTALSQFLYRRSVAQDAGNGAEHLATMRKVSAPGMLLFALSLTFASFDWLMSLEPHWYSTMFGVYYFSGAVQGGLALIVVVLLLLKRFGLLDRAVTVEHFHDLGKLLFGFTVFYAYIAFSQYFLIWYANMPEETSFFMHRWEPGWQPLSLATVFVGFVAPFFTLISRQAKRIPFTMALGASLVLLGRFIDMVWLVMPTFEHGAHLSVPLVAAFFGVGGFFACACAFFLSRSSLVPVGDPYLSYSLGHENV